MIHCSPIPTTNQVSNPRNEVRYHYLIMSHSLLYVFINISYASFYWPSICFFFIHVREVMRFLVFTMFLLHFIGIMYEVIIRHSYFDRPIIFKNFICVILAIDIPMLFFKANFEHTFHYHSFLLSERHI